MSVEITSGHRRGRFERAIDRLYARIGSRVVLVCIAAGTVIGLATAVVIVAVAFRYLGLSAGHAASFAELWAPIFLGLVGLAIWLHRDEYRQSLSWSPGGKGGSSAPRTWYIGVRIPHLVARVAAVVCTGFVPAALYVVLHFHRPWYDFFPMLVGGLVALSSVAVLISFGSELACRPMLRDIAARLPPDFEPRIRGLPLRTRALVPLPIVTFFAAMTVGAYVDVVHDRNLRLLFALGVCSATVAVATVVFAIVNRTFLAPIDELLAATERVRQGDINTRVPLVSADELGRLSSSFNEMLADLRRHTGELQESRERIVAAADAERRRVERDIHDGAQQQLVLAQLKLGMLERLVPADSTAKTLVAELREDLDRALAELRDLAHGLYPPVLESDGLAAALSEAAGRSPLPASLNSDGIVRYPPEVEAAVYFSCLEALQNAAKHAGEGARATVRLADQDGLLRFEVADDGRGFDPGLVHSTSGLQNIADRIGAFGGEVHVNSAPGRGTTVTGSVPVGSAV